MNVYRIQDIEGRGPWRPGFSHTWVEGREDHNNLIPWIVEFGRVDKKLLAGEFAGSGCKTLIQLRRWFTLAEYETLLYYKYKCVLMGVDRVIAESDIQLFFGRCKPLNVDFQIVDLYQNV
jgi:hypothetical protein